jgi:hypothetical protein
MFRARLNVNDANMLQSGNHLRSGAISLVPVAQTPISPESAGKHVPVLVQKQQVAGSRGYHSYILGRGDQEGPVYNALLAGVSQGAIGWISPPVYFASWRHSIARAEATGYLDRDNFPVAVSHDTRARRKLTVCPLLPAQACWGGTSLRHRTLRVYQLMDNLLKRKRQH